MHTHTFPHDHIDNLNRHLNRRKFQPEAKAVLFYLSCFDLVDNFFMIAINGQTGFWCELQAGIIQFFNIGGKLWEVCLAIETYVLVGKVFKKGTTASERKKSAFYRHLAYWTFIVTHGVLTVSIMLSDGHYVLTGHWCWSSDPLERIYYCYMQLWLGMAVILCLNASVVVTMRKMIQQKEFLARKWENRKYQSEVDRQDSDTESSQRSESTSPQTSTYDKKTQLFYIKMVVAPILFIISQLPGSIRRGAQAAGTDQDMSEDVRDNLASTHALFQPLKGFFNFTIFVLLDRGLRREYKEVFDNLCVSVGTSLGYDMTVNKQLLEEKCRSNFESLKEEVGSQSSNIGFEMSKTSLPPSFSSPPHQIHGEEKDVEADINSNFTTSEIMQGSTPVRSSFQVRSNTGGLDESATVIKTTDEVREAERT